MSARYRHSGGHTRNERRRPASHARPRPPIAQGALTLTPADALPLQTPETEIDEIEGSPITSRADTLGAIRGWLAGRASGFADFIRRRTVEQWAWVVVLLVAAVLRFWDLGYKALHHDESMHAFYSLLFARDPSSYLYNPLLHGPFQFHAEGLVFMLIMAAQSIFHVSSLGNNPWITDTTARIVPALFGIGIVALPLGLRRELGRLGALVAGALLAVSPSFVYFSRFLREDIYFNFFMFAMVVCAVRFARSRRMTWLALTAAATILAYATFEGIFITLVIFGSFLAIVLVWELAESLAPRIPLQLDERRRRLLARSVSLVALAGVGAIVGVWALHTMRTLSAYIQAHTTQADAQVLILEQRTVAVLLYLSIALALFVIIALFWQLTRDNVAYARAERAAMNLETDIEGPVPLSERILERIERVASAPGRLAARLRDRLDPERQPLLRLLLGISWMQWFVAFVVAWMVFIAMFWAAPGPGRTLGQGFEEGIGRGVWQGLYYWLQQQDVARGAQPFYYYLLLIPLYEQLAVVFGLAGVVYSLFRPTRFRLFLVWWFVLSLGIYSWAGEKMPWLSIHILLPLMLLAAMTVSIALRGAWAFVGQLRAGTPFRGALTRRSGGLVASAALSVLLFIPMVHSMYLLSYVNPSNGPLEMMVYVQTTQDVDTVMSKINYADQKLYGGKHQLRIVVGQGEEWPFYWYLRDYWLDAHPSTYVTWDPSGPSGTNPFASMNPDVLILFPGADVQAFFQAHPTGYHEKEYVLRSWFDESYKPQLACQQHPGTACPPNTNYAFYGQGLGPWLSYGSTPPANAKFNAGHAAVRLWDWLWFRKPLGSTKGPYYDFVFIVRDGLPIQP